MILEDRLVRDLPEKSQVELDDYIIIEDLDGTKLAPIKGLGNAMKNNLVVNNIEEMKCRDFSAGDTCVTLGYYSPGDGGGAVYRIMYEPTAVDDKANWHYLYTSDTLRAKFIPRDGIVTPEQFGAHGDGLSDDYAAITKCFGTLYKVAFSSGKTYRINKPIQFKSNMHIDLNGCIIKPHNCEAFSIPSSYAGAECSNIDIMNGRINMADAVSSTAISIKKLSGYINVENISISGGQGKAIECMLARKLTVNNCEFANTSIKTAGIHIGNPPGDTPNKSINIMVNNTTFTNYTRSIMVDNTSGNINLYFTNGTAYNEQSNVATACVYNARTETGQGNRQITIDNLQTAYIDCALHNISDDICVIRNVKMREAKCLIKGSSVSGTTTIEGSISMYGAAATSLYPIFDSCGGNIFINTSNIRYNSSRYCERNMGNASYSNCTMYDIVPIDVRPEVKSAISSSSISVPFFRNGIIRVTSGGNITSISGGIKNQVIGLKTTAGATISSNTSIGLKGGGTKALDGVTLLRLKYDSANNRWNEIQ